VRRGLGFKLKVDGYLLADFVAFLEIAGAERITSDLAVTWARRPGASARYHMERLSMVRGFARYLATIDLANEIPPVDALHARETRNAPYLYSEREIGELIAVAAALTPAQRGATYRAVIGVIATSGLRVGETLDLDHGDVDLELGVLHVRDGKGRRHRDVPVHHTTTQVLRDYARLRDRACPRPDTPAFFISAVGARITRGRFHKTFRKLIAQVAPQPGRERAHRRPHDLRHSFAVRTLLSWHHAGVDIDRAMPLLSTYLGHANPNSSYWYLQASPELMALVANRLEDALGGRP
jgi:site-specific recombinase XerD